MIRICALAACCIALPGVAAVAAPAGLSVALQAPPGQEPSLMLAGNGVQIYTCMQLPLQPNAYAWVGSAPDVTLYDGTRGVARLTSPEHWESLDDRSSVSGIVTRMQAGGTGNLPWQLISAIPVGDTGMFAGVTTIQRVNTRGGALPTDPCDETHAGNEARQAFSADYYFYKRAGTG